jgi:hypothetical protein
MDRLGFLGRRLRMLSLLCALAVAALGATGSAGANAEATPFTGTFAGTISGSPCGPLTICLEGTLAGVATHLGRSTLEKEAVVHITFAPCPGGIEVSYTQTVTLTAANGDTLELVGDGVACSGGGSSIGGGDLAVTGGTGRFQDARGSLSERFVHDLASGVEMSELSGTISAAGAKP